MSFRYRLIDQDGNDLGPLATRRNDWQPGETVSRWHGEELEILNVVDAPVGDTVAGYIVVAAARS